MAKNVTIHIRRIKTNSVVLPICWYKRSTYYVASFPGPAQLSVAFSTEKRERAWYPFSREHDVRIERMVERV